MTRKILPIGIQTFREIRDGDHYYVDKTDFARRLIGEGKYYFLSRLTPEESSHAGRLDLALRFNGQVYLFEFKVVELEPEGRALQQIKERGYADKYRADGQPIHLIGVEFSRERRQVVGFAVETLD